MNSDSRAYSNKWSVKPRLDTVSKSSYNFAINVISKILPSNLIIVNLL